MDQIKIDASDTELLLYHIKNVCIILVMILHYKYERICIPICPILTKILYIIN